MAEKGGPPLPQRSKNARSKPAAFFGHRKVEGLPVNRKPRSRRRDGACPRPSHKGTFSHKQRANSRHFSRIRPIFLPFFCFRRAGRRGRRPLHPEAGAHTGRGNPFCFLHGKEKTDRRAAFALTKGRRRSPLRHDGAGRKILRLAALAQGDSGDLLSPDRSTKQGERHRKSCRHYCRRRGRSRRS